MGRQQALQGFSERGFKFKPFPENHPQNMLKIKKKIHSPLCSCRGSGAFSRAFSLHCSESLSAGGDLKSQPAERAASDWLRAQPFIEAIANSGQRWRGGRSLVH
ncbi:hypothetical protein GDO78_022751 [Eleutherodactylus coqui]|uniref:Uncharacterized protein n=1 Tax=Eleutherodactylus coqui TaxID=57060 RepID=A0A8J6EFS5_ELECQ|nr:hypothetical protein GDO78_022751 [Eleutherodactylus coqui]